MSGGVRVRGLRREDLPRWLPLWQGYLDYYRTELAGDVTADVFDRLAGPDPTVYGLVAFGTSGRAAPAPDAMAADDLGGGRGPMAGDDEQLVGFAHCVVHPNTWSTQDDTYLEDLYVLPAARGSGVGRALVEAIADRAAAAGHRRVHWLTESGNDRARRLYDDVGELTDYVRYVRDLPARDVSADAPGRPVGVFCASARGLDRSWHGVAEEVGTLLGERGHRLVYGGTDSGTMATLAKAARAAGAHVTGVTLQQFLDPGRRDGVSLDDSRFDHDHCDELVVTTDLFDRKRQLVVRADGFVALPGGFGTFDELGDVVAGRRLGLHHKPMVLLDHAGFFTPLLASFELMAHTGFATVGGGEYQVAETAEQAVAQVEAAWRAAEDVA